MDTTQTPLTPNTSAFLSYLASSYDPPAPQAGSTDQPVPANTSFPPSTFFSSLPVPGRDTPEDTPSSKETSESPSVDVGAVNVLLSDDSDDAANKSSRRDSGAGVHPKRKGNRTQANHHHRQDEHSEGSLESESADAHEDKKHEPTKPRGRKVKTEVDENGKPLKEMTKAQRRKEQNRQAQKNFRERREAKVRDLEEKVAELENKSYGVNVENENLRGILKRLQEENVALKQAAFTFSMPAKAGAGASGAAPAQPAANPQSTFRPPSRQISPNQGGADDTLRSIHDVSRHESLDSTPESTTSESQKSQPPQLMGGMSQNGFDTSFLNGNTMRPSPPGNSSSQQTGLTPLSSGSSQKTEIEALWANFLDQQNNQRQAAAASKGPVSPLKDQAYSMFANNNNNNNNNPEKTWNPFSNGLGPANNGTSFPSFGASPAAKPSFDKMAFRDDKQPSPPTGQVKPADPWAADSSMQDFLASLQGKDSAEQPEPLNGITDEDFNAQLLKLLGDAASPSAPFNLPNTNGPSDNPFSPTNYLNMDGSPLASGSNASPSTNASGPNGSSLSASASPESTAGSGGAGTSATSISTTDANAPAQANASPANVQSRKCPGGGNGEHVYVIGNDGKVVKSMHDPYKELGLDKSNAIHNLLVDDLCEQMKNKATCKDGKTYLSQADAEFVLQRKQFEASLAKGAVAPWG